MKFSVRYKDFYSQTIYEGYSIPYKFAEGDRVLINHVVWEVVSILFVPESNTLLIGLKEDK